MHAIEVHAMRSAVGVVVRTTIVFDIEGRDDVVNTS
jgi:hypothetical protein